MEQDEKDLSLKHLAHDLNNIFTRILASLELLKLQNQSEEKYSLLLNNIEAGTYLASELINTTIGKSSSPTQNKRININTIIKDVVNSFQGYTNEKIKFNLYLQPDLKMINAKYVDLYRIIMNLITNAVESIELYGNITIKTSLQNKGEQVQILISDDGNGIDENLYKFIFTEGFSTKTKDSNSGHGLSIVKYLVELYNGEIIVASEKERGTQFNVTFPASAASKGKSNTPKTILIAEDENSLRFLLKELLQSYNYNVISASDGIETLKLFSTSKCDILIIDKKMPGMDGVECIKEIRKNNLEVPIILASGSITSDENLVSSLKISYLLSKPYNLDEIISAIENILT